jgi:hypothetical protein
LADLHVSSIQIATIHRIHLKDTKETCILAGA